MTRRGFKCSAESFYWSRRWQPIPVFLPGKLHGKRILTGYNPWGCKVSDTTEKLSSFYTDDMLSGGNDDILKF